MIREAKRRLKSERESERCEAVELLSQIGHVSGTELLAQQLERETSAYVRRRIIRILGEMRNHRTALMVSRLLSSSEAAVRNGALEILCSLQKVALPVLAELMTEESRDLRKMAVEALGAIACEEAFPLLVTALRDDDPNVAAGAVESLGRHGDGRAVPYLRALLQRSISAWLAFAVIEALTQLGDAAAMEDIDRYLRQSGGTSRERAALAGIWAVAAGKLGFREQLPQAWELYLSGELTSREMIMLMSQWQQRGIDVGPSHGPMETLIAQQLEQGGREESLAAAHLAAQNLPHLLYIHLPLLSERIGKEEEGLNELIVPLLKAGPSASRVTALLDGADSSMKRLLLSVAERSMLILPLERLRAYAGDSDLSIVRLAVAQAWRCGSEAEEFLAEMTHHRDPETVLSALSGLGLLGGEKSNPLLLKALEHSDSRIRRQAIDTLTMIGTPGLHHELKRRMDHCPEKFWPDILEVMTAQEEAPLAEAFLRASLVADREIRSQVARICRLIRRDDAFLSVMETLANDPEPEVRRMAITSLAARSGDGVYRILAYLYEHDPCTSHRYYIFTCSEIYRHRETFDWLVENLEQPDRLLQLAAVRGMTKMGAAGRDYLEAFLDSLPNDDEELKQIIGQELDRNGGYTLDANS
ncbi:HEAT repeat domain-containing protein [Heliobacterium mobile]|uniref:HEAT repeat domain-containing protein n=1 Tax=Heliobacterium mobile TaxID=28064 RepID=UPI0014790F22|nr:HEAT repeat domain-containing protein [Heliobacterium mobile]